MKKVIRLTESDLARIIKRVINEQNTIKRPKDISQDQARFEEYVQKKMFPTEADIYAGEQLDWDGESWKICTLGCTDNNNPLDLDSDIVKWNFKTKQIEGIKSFGVDPKPIPFSSNYNDSVKWFDSWFKY